MLFPTEGTRAEGGSTRAGSKDLPDIMHLEKCNWSLCSVMLLFSPFTSHLEYTRTRLARMSLPTRVRFTANGKPP